MHIVTLTQKGWILSKSINNEENERSAIVAALAFRHGTMTSNQIHELVGENSGLWIRSLERDGIVTIS